MKTVRILLVDDSREFLAIVHEFVTGQSQMDVVDTCSTGNQAIKLASVAKPDLIVMDISMPGMSGLEATRLIKSQPEPPRVIVLTMHDDDWHRNVARSCGADGFVAKTELTRHLMPLIRKLFGLQQAES